MARLIVRVKKAITSPIIGMKKTNGEPLSTPAEGTEQHIILYIISKDEEAPIRYEWERTVNYSSWDTFTTQQDNTQVDTETTRYIYRLKLTYAGGIVRYSNEVVYTKKELKIYWFYGNQLRIGETEDKSGQDSNVQVGAEKSIGFEKKDPNSQNWISIDTGGMRKKAVETIPITMLGTTEIRGYDTNEQGQRYYSNILRFTKIEEDFTPVPPGCRQYLIRIRPRTTVMFSYIDCSGQERNETWTGDADDRVENEVYIFAQEGSISGNVSYEPVEN